MANNSLTGKDPSVAANHALGIVEFIRSGAYVSLTDIAKLHGKRVSKWMELKSTKELIACFESNPIYSGDPAFVTVKGNYSDNPNLSDRSNLSDSPKLGYHSQDPALVKLLGSRAPKRGKQGTFAHPDIAIAFAQWCSPGFQLWVSAQIRALLTHGEVNLNHSEWTADQHKQGLEFNRDDTRELYSR